MNILGIWKESRKLSSRQRAGSVRFFISMNLVRGFKVGLGSKAKRRAKEEGKRINYSARTLKFAAWNAVLNLASR